MGLRTYLLTGAAMLSIGAVAVLADARPASANWGCTSSLYKQGSRGGCVKSIQQMYNSNVTWAKRGMSPLNGSYIAEDGVFGPATARAIRSFQAFNKLSTDAIVGNNTWRLLCRPLSAAGHIEGGRAYVMVFATDYSMPLAYQAGCGKYYASNITYVVQ